MMSAVILLPSDFIVDALLRLQIRCCFLHIIFGVHLGERRHHKGLTDIQIEAAVTIQLVQPLRRGTEVAVVLVPRSARRPRLAQPEYPRILCIEALLPLPIYAPVIAHKASRFIARSCHCHIINFMLPINTGNHGGLFTDTPGTLQIQTKRTVFFTGMVSARRFCPHSGHIRRTSPLCFPRVEVQATLPVPILIVQLGRISIGNVFTRIIGGTCHDSRRTEVNMCEGTCIAHLTFIII